MLQSRRDISVYNEATGFVITSACLNGFTPDDFKGKGWERRIEDGTFLPVELVQDDGLCFRVIVNEELTDKENGEWTDRLVCTLHIPDGKLAISGGASVLEDQSERAEFVRVLDVEPGTYQVELFTNFSGVNGDWCLAKAGVRDDAIPEYFQRTRPGERMPEWMRDWLDLEYEIGDEDPEVARTSGAASPLDSSWDAWQDDPEEEPSQAIEPEHIDFTLRISPLQGTPPLPKLKNGWASIAQNPRVPERCPTGLLSWNVEGVHDHGPDVQSELVYRAEVADRVRDLPFTPVQGGPVALPISELALPYWFAWMCRDGVFPQLRLSPRKLSEGVTWPGLRNGFKISSAGDETVVDFEGNNAKWTNIRRLHRAGKLLQALPDGLLVQLDTCEELEDDEEGAERLAGFHRYRGQVQGGKWLISETYPEIGASELTDILNLAREVDRGGPISMRNATEIKSVLAKIRESDFLLRDKAPTIDGLALRAEDLMLTGMLGAWVLRERYGGLVPMISLDDDLDSWDQTMGAIERAFAAVHVEGDPLLEGESGTFYRSDMTSHQAMKSNPSEVADHDRAMSALGMAALGDITCSRFTDVVIRGYAHHELPILGAMNRNGFGFGSSDLFTLFEDGWSLTTSTIAASDEPTKRIYRQGGCENLAELMLAHLSRIAELSSKHGPPSTIRPDLRGFAEAVDGFLVRQFNLHA